MVEVYGSVGTMIRVGQCTWQKYSSKKCLQVKWSTYRALLVLVKYQSTYGVTVSEILKLLSNSNCKSIKNYTRKLLKYCLTLTMIYDIYIIEVALDVFYSVFF